MEQSKGRIINEWDILDENLHRQEAAMPFSQFVARHVSPSLLQYSSPVAFQLSRKHRLRQTPMHQSYCQGCLPFRAHHPAAGAAEVYLK
jgi:hypothetical protein